MRVMIETSAARQNATQLLGSYSLSGSAGRCARTLELSMAVADDVATLPRCACPLGALVEVETDGGECLFSGMIVRRKPPASGKHVMALTCLDRGLYLANNDGWYTFRDTPEAAVRRICGDFGIEVGALCATGVVVARKFAGVELSKIITTMYALAAEKTGKRYILRFAGRKLTVEEKPLTAQITLAPRVNLIDTSFEESIEKMHNSVAIYDENGKLVRTLDDKDAQAAYGLMQTAITQKKGKDALAEAQKKLEDGEAEQTVSVDILGDTRLVTGGAVLLRAGSTGAQGLFWIDSDTHTWKNGLCFTKLKLNFKNMMDEQNAGSEVK